MGPESVKYELTSKALCFGGSVCTATDVALMAGVAKGTCMTHIENALYVHLSFLFLVTPSHQPGE